MKRAWKRIDDAALKAIWPTHVSDKEMATRLGRHRGVLRRRAKQLGLPSRRLIWARSPTFPATVTLSSDLHAALAEYAASQKQKPETIIAEALRAYLGLAQ